MTEPEKPTEETVETNTVASKIPVETGSQKAQENPSKIDTPQEATDNNEITTPSPTPVEPTESDSLAEKSTHDEIYQSAEMVEQPSLSSPAQQELPREIKPEDSVANISEIQSTNISIRSRQDEPSRIPEKQEQQAPAELLVIQFGKDSTQLGGVNEELLSKYMEFLSAKETL